MADQLITIRQTIRTAARQFGLRATFMPKPFTDAPGSGVHVFQQFRRLDAGSDLGALSRHRIGDRPILRVHHVDDFERRGEVDGRAARIAMFGDAGIGRHVRVAGCWLLVA